MRHNIQTIHFIGVGGSGMAGLAEVMAGMGYQVSGSDVREQASLARLRARGVEIFIGHDATHVARVDCAVYSSAVAEDNIERVAAAQSGIPTVPRAQMLGELMRFKPGIAVAGTHGKTTVSSIIAHILTVAELSPTCVIGGRLLSVTNDELIGNGEYVVVEADESDASFLHLQPVMAVVTNIDNDHLEAFDNDFATLSAAFVRFLENLPFYGTAVICNDDAATAAMAEQIKSRRIVRYGLLPGADYTAVDLASEVDGMTYTLVAGGGRYPMKVGALGEHNVQNALAATAVAFELGVPVNAVQQGLATFAGVGRRLEFYGDININGKRALLVDDYAHHPVEINATLQALRAAYPTRRLFLIFQPHRYTRTQRLFAPLAQALSHAEQVLLLPIYPAGESMPAQPLAQELLAALTTPAGEKTLCADEESLLQSLSEQIQEDDLLVCMGAGDIGMLPAKLQERYHV